MIEKGRFVFCERGRPVFSILRETTRAAALALVVEVFGVRAGKHSSLEPIGRTRFIRDRALELTPYGSSSEEREAPPGAVCATRPDFVHVESEVG
jgi:hypothetical protein